MPCSVAPLQASELHLARARADQPRLEELVLAVVSRDPQHRDGPLLAWDLPVLQVQFAPDLLQWSTVVAARAGFPKDGDLCFHGCMNIQLSGNERKVGIHLCSIEYNSPREVEVERMWSVGRQAPLPWWKSQVTPLALGPYIKPSAELEVGQ